MQNTSTFRIALACFLILLGSMLSSHLPAQNWHPFPSGGPLLYSFHQQFSNDEWYFAARIDSVRLEGADSAHYLYRIDRPLAPSDQLTNCQGDSLSWLFGSIAINRDHYLGKKMLQRPNGECVFVSSAADSFLLRPLAQAGQSWSWQAGIAATVDSVVAGAVLGAPDSLKYISLSSGKHIVLSKAHGMVACFSFLPFYNAVLQAEVVDFAIWGIPGQGLGGHFPNFDEIYDYDVADRFGLHERDQYPTGSTEAWIAHVIQSVQPGTCTQYGATMEEVIITAQSGNPVDSTYHAPTAITLTCDSTYYDLIGLLPYETHAPTTNFAPEFYQSGVRLLAGSNGRLTLNFEQQSLLDTCAMAYVPFESATAVSLGAGLGEIYYSYTDVGQSNFHEMYCYQKGSESWGTCLDLSTLIGVTPAAATAFALLPNPASSLVRIQLAESSTNPHEIALLGINGQVIHQTTLPAQETTLDLNICAIPAGMYMIQIQSPDQSTTHRKLVITH